MQGYLPFLLLTYYVITISLSDAIEENDNTAAIDLKEKYAHQRRKLPIFPKNTLKFVVTPRPQVNLVYNRKEKVMIKMPIMPHFTLKPKTETIATTQPISRKPLMKLRTFTIKPRTNGKYNDIEKLARHTTPVVKTAESPRTPGKSKTDPVTPIPEVLITEKYLAEESQFNVERLLESDGSSQQNKETQKSVNSNTNADNISPEEEQDRNEFIFIDNKKKKQVVSDMLDITGEDFDKASETTTEFYVIDKDTRVKRSINIIEEENKVSTVSSLKYTGRETKLTNDVYFKNINS